MQSLTLQHPSLYVTFEGLQRGAAQRGRQLSCTQLLALTSLTSLKLQPVAYVHPSPFLKDRGLVTWLPQVVALSQLQQLYLSFSEVHEQCVQESAHCLPDCQACGS